MTRSQLKICGGTKDRTRDLVTSQTAHPTDLVGPASELKAATLAEWFKVLTSSHRCSHMDSNQSCSCTTVKILSFRTDRPGQTVQTQIRLLLEEQSDQGLHCLPFHLHRLDSLLYGTAP